jgi:hypothetical protein
MEILSRDRQRRATLDEVPYQGFYFSSIKHDSQHAIDKVMADPSVAVVEGTWSLSRGDAYVPMIKVFVDDTLLNVDIRDGCGKKIYEGYVARLEEEAERRQTTG